MFHNHVSLKLRILIEYTMRKMTIFIDGTSITAELFNAENFNDITRGREKGEAETYATRFMDRARNYDWNAVDRFTETTGRPIGAHVSEACMNVVVRLEFLMGHAVVCAFTTRQERVAVLLDRVRYKYYSRIPQAFFRNGFPYEYRAPSSVVHFHAIRKSIYKRLISNLWIFLITVSMKKIDLIYVITWSTQKNLNLLKTLIHWKTYCYWNRAHIICSKISFISPSIFIIFKNIYWNNRIFVIPVYLII